MTGLLKKLLSFVAYWLNLWPAVFRMCHVLERKPILAAFTFHRITTEEPDERYLQGYERGVTLAMFERQINWIARFYRIIDLPTFADIATGKNVPTGKRPLALLTLDDADSEHLLAFAALKRRGYPGVAFVPTAFIDTDKRFYHLRLTNICNSFSSDSWQMALAGDVPADVKAALQGLTSQTLDERRRVRARLIKPFQKMQPAARDHLLERWEELIDHVYSLGIACMSWREIIEWSSQGIVMESHTVNHNCLAILDDDAVVSELADSRTALERQTGQAVTAISYPEGSFDTRTPGASEETGYELGFTGDSGLVSYPLNGQDRFLIPRVGAKDGNDREICYSIGSVALMRLLMLIRKHGRNLFSWLQPGSGREG